MLQIFVLFQFVSEQNKNTNNNSALIGPDEMCENSWIFISFSQTTSVVTATRGMGELSNA